MPLAAGMHTAHDPGMRHARSEADTRRTVPVQAPMRSVSERVRPWVATLGLVALVVIVLSTIPGVEGTGERVEAPPPILPPAEGPVLLLEVVDGIEFVMVGGRVPDNCVDLNLKEPYPRYLGEACGGDSITGAVGGAGVEVDGGWYLAVFGVAPGDATSVLVVHPSDGGFTRVTPRGAVWIHVESLPAVPDMPVERHVTVADGRGDSIGSGVVRVGLEG